MRRAFRLLCLIVVLLLTPATLAGQQTFEQGLLELRVSGANPVLARTLVDTAGTVLVPLTELLRLTQIPFTQSPTAWTFQWPPPGFATTLDPVTGVFSRQALRDTIPVAQRFYQAPELFLSLQALERLLGVQVQYQEAELYAAFSTTGGFPINRRADIERRMRARAPGTDRAALAGVPYPALTGGLALNWSASGTAITNQRSTAGLRGSIGLAVLGGELELSGDAFNTGPATSAQSLLRYSRPFPENPWIQQLTLGAITTMTPVPVYMDGITISNAPYIPPEFFQATVVRPAVPTGWVAEVYEGNHLLGVTQAVGQEGVEVPLSYGMNPVRVKLIGPAGQELTEDLQYLVPSARVPVGTVRYSLGAGRCRIACEDFVYGGVNTGILLGLSAGAGVEHATTDSASQTRPYVSIGLNPRPDLTIDGHAVLGYSEQLDAQFAGLENANLQFTLSNTHKAALAGGGSEGLRLGLNGALRVRKRTVTVLNQLVDTRAPGIDRFLLSLGTPLGTGFIFMQQEFAQRTPDLFSVRLTRSFALPGLRRAPLSTEMLLGTAGNGIDLFTLQGGVQVPRFGSVQLRSQWRRGTSPQLSLSLHSRRNRMTTASYVAVQNRSSNASVSLSGSLVVDPAHNITAAPENAVGLAGIAGRAFLDENGNGRRDPEESVVPEITVSADGRLATTDADGRYSLWGVRPVRPTPFLIDTLAVPSVELMAVSPARLLRPVPNAFMRADIPLVRSREVSGSVLDPVGAGVGGVAVEVRTSSGQLVLDTRTFSDGGFYFPRVGPGDYIVSVAPASLAALGIAAAPESLRLSVPHGGGDPLRLPPIRLGQ